MSTSIFSFSKIPIDIDLHGINAMIQNEVSILVAWQDMASLAAFHLP
jgi:hypothetical protein